MTSGKKLLYKTENGEEGTNVVWGQSDLACVLFLLLMDGGLLVPIPPAPPLYPFRDTRGPRQLHCTTQKQRESIPRIVFAVSAPDGRLAPLIIFSNNPLSPPEDSFGEDYNQWRRVDSCDLGGLTNDFPYLADLLAIPFFFHIY